MQTSIAVIGAGLIGSAAAAYLQGQNPDRQVLLIGPGEPGEGTEPLVYASHYDAARVQRLIGKDATWTRLNLESAQAYPALEAETGIRFHEGVGCLYVSPHGEDDYLARLEEDGDAFGLPFARLADAGALASAVPDYTFPPGSVGMLEEGPAGLIRPRRLLQAQLARFRQRGGRHIGQTVIERETIPYGHRLHLDNGTHIEAAQVLVAAGSFANFHNLLPRPLDIQLKGETILLAEVSEEDADRLQRLPTLLYELFRDDLDGIYLTGPQPYPDGKAYIKMGCNLQEDQYFTTLQQVQAWFKSDSSRMYQVRLQTALAELLPGIAPVSVHTRHCIIHRTPSGRPCIGHAGAPGLYVVAGCNGYSAMCSDALGRLAAHYVQWDTLPASYEHSLFAPQFMTM